MIMRTTSKRSSRRARGYALLMVVVLSGLSLLVLGATMTWTSTSARLTARNIDYFNTVSAAEAATEKILARVATDFRYSGESEVYGNLETYRATVPTTGESDYWSQFTFNNAQGTDGRTFVDRIAAQGYVDLDSAYAGLRGFASTYRILSNAQKTGTGGTIVAAVNQDIQVASIPVFQFAIFYGLDLELNTMTTMNINGRVHGNSTIYTYPSAPLTFWSDVTSVGNIIKTRKPGDPAFSLAPPAGAITYKTKKATGVTTMSLPIGTNNSPSAVHAVVEVPPDDEAPTSGIGMERYYNKAQLVILVGDTNVTALAKTPFSSSSTSIPWDQLTNLVSTNIAFTDQRENKTVHATQIDVSKLGNWSVTNTTMNTLLSGAQVNLLYVADRRSTSASTMNAVRLVNGQTLPNRGLTVATMNPLYVKGHYNQPNNSYLGTTNTSTALPASLISDALTVLSPTWNDAASGGSYTGRNASSMTVNAAILTGIVETSQALSIYSGGAHNLARFLEDWGSDAFTCNGSMVVLFPSQIATKPFQQPGAYYNPPSRNYSFDLNYMDAAKLPPGTPQLRAIIRSSWSQVAPGTTNIAFIY